MGWQGVNMEILGLGLGFALGLGLGGMNNKVFSKKGIKGRESVGRNDNIELGRLWEILRVELERGNF